MTSRPASVVVLGNVSNWLPAIGAEAPVWRDVAGILNVREVRTVEAARALAGQPDALRMVVPLKERDILRVPRFCWALIPSRRAVAILANKGRFARYVARGGLERYCPATYSRRAPAFPCVLKRLNLHGGDGCVLVHTPDELRQLLRVRPWRRHFVLLQEFIGGADERVTHAICIDGRVRWDRTYEYHLESLDVIRRVDDPLAVTVRPTPAVVIEALEAMLVPLAYDGPLNVDYKLDAAGRLAIFEINPRFGGSLMRPLRQADLQSALAFMVANAKWQGARTGR